MIAKITVHDNDFHDLMNMFCNSIREGEIVYGYDPTPEEPQDSDTLNNDRLLHKNTIRILRKTASEMTMQDRVDLTTTIGRAFKRYTYARRRMQPDKITEETEKYLNEKLIVTFEDRIEETDENGEIFYIIFTSNPPVVINL